MARPRDSIINCPRCGKPQSRYKYETECCWDCGSVAPLPPPSVRNPVRFDSEFQDVATDVEVGTDDTGTEAVDESGIKKMSEL